MNIELICICIEISTGIAIGNAIFDYLIDKIDKNN